MNTWTILNCEKRVHCKTCRTDAAWRQSLVDNKFVEERDFDCPFGIALEPAPSPYDGSAKWKELRTAAYHNKITKDWLQTWASDLPIFGCKCKSHWETDLKANPLPSINQFVWYVKHHNEVNKRLGKPILTLEQAKAIAIKP